VDVYAGRYLVSIEDPTLPQGPLREALERIHPEFGFSEPAKFFWIGKEGLQKSTLASNPAERFEVRENGFRFEVRLGEGPHTGLFLDQRDNRRRLSALASGRRCLNLFAYTGAFSVAAGTAGATEVLSVDLSKSTLRWLEKNLALNQIPASRAPFLAKDVFQYLKGARRSRTRFDLIILDPPTFSRGQTKVFSTERDFGTLVQDCAGLLQATGRMLVSLNTRKISPSDFRNTVKSALQPLGKKILETPSLPPDFRLGEEEKKNPPVKFCWVV